MSDIFDCVAFPKCGCIGKCLSPRDDEWEGVILPRPGEISGDVHLNEGDIVDESGRRLTVYPAQVVDLINEVNRYRNSKPTPPAPGGTPRTDEEIEIAKKFPATNHGLWVSAEFARQLERELVEVMPEVLRWRAYQMERAGLPSANGERDAENFIRCVRQMVTPGAALDLRDSPKSLLDNLERLLADLDKVRNQP